ncbi:hypothetical protein GDO81_027737 [Engystomops pustulosus]|uniref:Uncharacterized protein n=1 Tax=Engystomops pustulosus TaxID=76066 RepID=A0AAV6ZER6_ENGPU|nr:hypothetical protein GDO81_027737 [Engystomops pustulosus]
MHMGMAGAYLGGGSADGSHRASCRLLGASSLSSEQRWIIFVSLVGALKRRRWGRGQEAVVTDSKSRTCLLGKLYGDSMQQTRKGLGS